MKNIITNWPIKKLCEVCIINPKKSELSGFADDTIVSFVPMPSVNEFSQLITTQQEKELSEVKKGYTYFKKGDILFAKITPCMENGKVAHAKNLNTEIGFGSTEFHVLRAKDEVLPEYIYSLVSSSAFRVEAETKMTGSAGQKRVPKEFIENYELVIPSLEEQKRIVDILELRIGSIKEAIQLRKDVIADTEKILSAKLSAIFTEGKEKGWQEKPLLDVCQTTQGIQLAKSEQVFQAEKGYARYLYISDFYSEKKIKYVRDLYPVKVVTENDLIMANTGSPGMVFKGIPGILSNNLFRITFDKSVLDRDFLYYYLSSYFFQQQLQAQMKGGAQQHLGHKTISKQVLIFPDLKTQEKIVKELDELSGQIAELNSLQEDQLENLKSLERAYLHEAFNGELA